MKTKSAAIYLTPLKRQFPAWKVLRLLGAQDHGGALVEMAVALPIMMLMLTGIFYFSMALYPQLQLAKATEIVREKKTALLCYEADAQACQRSIVARRICATLGCEIENL